MPAQLRVELSDEQKRKLKAWTKNPPKPHLRRRAWAILLIAEGKPAYEVAVDTRVRVHRTTIADWVERFQAEGLEGLKVQSGRGRKPAFFPPELDGGQKAS